MINSLTKEQEKLIPIYQKKWYNKFHSLEFDDNKAKEFVNFLYEKILNKKKPVVIILDSPMSCQLAINILKLKSDSQLRSKLGSQLDSQLDSQLRSQLDSQLDSQLYSQLYSQLRSQLDSQLGYQLDSQLGYQLRSQLRSQLCSQLRSQLDSQLRTQLYYQLRSQLRSQLGSQLDSRLDSQLYSQLRTQLDSQLDSQLRSKLDSQLRDQLRSQLYSQLGSQEINYYIPDYFGDVSWYGYLCFYDYINEILLPHIKIKLFDEYKKLVDSNIVSLITFEGIAFVSRPPSFINFDDNNRLHCLHDSALCFKDGWKLNYIHGVYFDEDIFTKFKNKTITSEEIIALKNAEQKAVLIQEIGYEKIFNDLKDKKLIDRQVKPFNHKPNELVTYELFEIQIDENINARCLKVEWYEKGNKRQTILGVPRNINDAIEAVAWTCYKTKEEWEKCLIKEA